MVCLTICVEKKNRKVGCFKFRDVINLPSLSALERTSSDLCFLPRLDSLESSDLGRLLSAIVEVGCSFFLCNKK